MHIAISAQEPRIDSPTDPRLGGSPYFMVFDTVSGTWSSIDNAKARSRASGTGLAAGAALAAAGVNVLLTGRVGPNSFAALQSKRIEVYVGVTGTVAEAAQAFAAGQLQLATAAAVASDWSPEHGA